MVRTEHNTMRGGKREGAGRKIGSVNKNQKPDKKQPLCVKLHPRAIEFLKTHHLAQSVLIETALSKTYGFSLEDKIK